MKKILIFLGIFALGIIIGFWYGVSIEEANEYLSESPNSYVLLNLGKKSGFGFFISTLIVCLCATVLIFLFSMHPLLSYLSLIIPLYFGYCLGFELTIMLRVCGISALILSVLGILIFRLGLGILFIFLSVAAIEQAASFAAKQQMLTICLFCLLVQTVFIILMSILIPIFCKMLVIA